MAEHEPALAGFLARPETDPPEEYIGGAVVVKPVLSEPERWLRNDLATLLFGWARASHQGAAALGMRWLVGTDVYVPDVLYLAPQVLSAVGRTGGLLTQTPDLVVEICPAAVDPVWFAGRAARFRAQGVRVVWLVDSAEETVALYAESPEPVVLGRGAVLGGGEVLPEFCMQLDDLFDTLLEEAQEST